MQLEGAVALITGAASGIGRALAQSLIARGARGVALVDQSTAVTELAESLNRAASKAVARPFVGDVTCDSFRVEVYQQVRETWGTVTLCVPAAGIAVDNQVAVKLDKETGAASLYARETMDRILGINLVAPVYWSLEMVAGIAQSRRQRGLGRWSKDEKLEGTIVFIGSIFSKGARGQLAYAMSKGGIAAAAASVRKEAAHFGVRAVLLHPGFVDTPMVRNMGDDVIAERVLPATQLGRLIAPEEIADAILFLVTQPAVRPTLWVDAGWNDPG
ncbi:MAG: SDR family oxidoreductase [Planctomycetota bacterium]